MLVKHCNCVLNLLPDRIFSGSQFIVSFGVFLMLFVDKQMSFGHDHSDCMVAIYVIILVDL